MKHNFGKFCSVDDDPGSGDKCSVYLAIYDEDVGAIIQSPQDARALAKFLIDWAEKVEGKK